MATAVYADPELQSLQALKHRLCKAWKEGRKEGKKEKKRRPPVLQFFFEHGDVDGLFLPESGSNGLCCGLAVLRLLAATAGALHAQYAFLTAATLAAHRDFRLASRRRTLGPRVTWRHARVSTVSTR